MGDQTVLKIQKFLLFAVSIVLIYFMATEIGEGAFFWPIMFVLAALCAVTFIALDRNIWLLIPIGLINPIPLTFLPIPFKAAELAFLLLFLYLVISHAAMRHQWVDLGPANIWLPAAVILLIIVNHQFEGGLGLRAFGSSMAGARRHALFFIGLCFYLAILSIRPLSRKWLTRLPGFYLVVLMIGAVPNLFSIFFPNLAIAMGIFWIFAGASDVMYYYGADIQRIGLAGSLGVATQLWLVSRYPMNTWFTVPRLLASGAGLAGGAVVLLIRLALGESEAANSIWIAVCAMSFFGALTVLWFWKEQLVPLLSVLALFACGLSGFRSSIFHFFLITAVAAVFWLRWRVIALAAGIAALMAVVIAGNQTWYELPDAVQRSLSFLPGRWDPVAVSSADSSTDFRRLIRDLYVEKYSQLNPWLGNGYKMMTRDVGGQTVGDRPLGVTTDEIEGYIRAKDFHIGWISLYDAVGIIGSLAFLWMCIYLLAYLYKQSRRIGWNRLSPLQVWVTCYLVDIIISYFAVFGSLADIMPSLMFAAGLSVVAFEYLPVVQATAEKRPALPEAGQPAAPAIRPGLTPTV